MGYGLRIMKSNQMQKLIEKAKAFFGVKELAIGAGALVALVILLSMPAGKPGTLAKSNGDLMTYSAAKGPLVIDVLESGSVEASESDIIRSKVEGSATIISIVPEGTVITEKDVKNKKVLVELDSSELREKALQQEITVQSTLAQYTDAKESYEIQVNQNESNLKAGELKVKFAKMDIEKYLGEKAAASLVEGKTDFPSLINSEDLGGEALQKKRKLQNDIDLAKEEAARANVKVDWTKKLFEKGYVTREDLQADELALKRADVNREQAETSLDLFERYEFQKDTEKLRSDFEEASKELQRIVAKNRSELSKAEARLKSSEAAYKSQSDQLKKLNEQIENCTMVATKPGLVVYANENPWRNERIEKGGKVIEQQEIIKIPDSTSMIVKANIHESVIARIHEGLKASITIDSMPEKAFEGVVKKVGILPDSQNRWFNPNLKVYTTEVSILGEHAELKPGMSAQVRIIINELKDVLLIPVQAVDKRGEDNICFVVTPLGPQTRIIRIGDYNDKFIEVKSGLKEGEKVVLNLSSLTVPSTSTSGATEAPGTAAPKKETPDAGH